MPKPQGCAANKKSTEGGYNFLFPKKGALLKAQTRGQDQPRSQINLIPRPTSFPDQPRSQINLSHCPYRKLPQAHGVITGRLPFPQKFSIPLP